MGRDLVALGYGDHHVVGTGAAGRAVASGGVARADLSGRGIDALRGHLYHVGGEGGQGRFGAAVAGSGEGEGQGCLYGGVAGRVAKFLLLGEIAPAV
jgi:hypothetical protein